MAIDTLTKELENKKGETANLSSQAAKSAIEAKEAKEAAEKAAKEAANSKNAATKSAANAAAKATDEIAKAKQEAADAIQKAKEEAEKAIGTAQEAQKTAEAAAIASQALVTQANTIASAKQSEADTAAAALKEAKDALDKAKSNSNTKQAETDLAIAQANEATTAANAKAAEAEAKAAAALKELEVAKALVNQAQGDVTKATSQAEKDAAAFASAEAEKKVALAEAEEAKAAKEAMAAQVAAAEAAKKAEQDLREAAEKQSGEDKIALEEAAQRIQAAETKEGESIAELETLKKQLEECKNSINRETLQSIILAFSNSSKSEIEFTLENDEDPDLNTLRQLIREQIKNRNTWQQKYNTIEKNRDDWQNAYTSMEEEKNDWQTAYTSMEEFIKTIADNINNPEWTGDDIPDGNLKELVNTILPLRNKESKVKDLEEFCSLLFFTSHILSTHFTAAERNPIKTGYNQLMANLNETRKYTDLSVVINILMPILNILEQLYQSGKEGSFLIKPDEFFKDSLGKDLFTFLKGQLKGDLTTEAINRHFANKTGRSEDGPLSKVYIIIDNSTNMMEVIQNQSGSAKEVSNAEIQKPLSYSSIAQRFDAALTSQRLSKYPVSNDITLSYPVLFYFLIFSFKQYLNTRQGKLHGTQCRLPRIFQQGQ